MSIKVGWYIKNKVTYIQLNGDFTEDAFIRAVSYRAELVRSVSSEQVHGIVDSLNSTANVSIQSFNKIDVPSNNGSTVSVGSKGVGKFVGSVVLQILKIDFTFVDTLDEALAYLQKVDRTLQKPSYTPDIVIFEEFN